MQLNGLKWKLKIVMCSIFTFSLVWYSFHRLKTQQQMSWEKHGLSIRTPSWSRKLITPESDTISVNFCKQSTSKNYLQQLPLNLIVENNFECCSVVEKRYIYVFFFSNIRMRRFKMEQRKLTDQANTIADLAKVRRCNISDNILWFQLIIHCLLFKLNVTRMFCVP